jgi:hypothetical protein
MTNIHTTEPPTEQHRRVFRTPRRLGVATKLITLANGPQSHNVQPLVASGASPIAGTRAHTSLGPPRPRRAALPAKSCALSGPDHAP